MSNLFFEQPILNSPYECPSRHWELDEHGQPTQRIVDERRKAEFITPIPKPKKRKGKRDTQAALPLGDDTGLSTTKQQYESMSIINEVRNAVSLWREKLKPSEWGVTPETARLLKHWRSYKFAVGMERSGRCCALLRGEGLTDAQPREGEANGGHRRAEPVGGGAFELIGRRVGGLGCGPA